MSRLKNKRLLYEVRDIISVIPFLENHLVRVRALHEKAPVTIKYLLKQPHINPRELPGKKVHMTRLSC